MLVMVAAGLWIYWPALQGDWLWDDNRLVTDNLDLRSLHGLWEIWFAAPATDYWPLTWTLLWIEWHLWGSHSLGYHLCSLVLHLSSGFLIWRLFNRLGLRYGWLGGLLFVIHPLAVESVAWVSEIKNTLSLPFFLLSFDAWLDAEEKKPSSYRRSVFYYLAAMLSKSSTIMLPVVLLLYCWWKRGRVTRQELKRMVPYLAIAAVLGLGTIYFQSRGPETNLAAQHEGFVTRAMGAGCALFFYMGKFILPMDLLPIYPRWALDPPSLLQMLPLPALALLLFGMWLRRGTWGRHVLFGLGFFLVNLMPVLLFMLMRYETMVWSMDHLAYISLIGLIGLFVAGLEAVRGHLSLFSRRFLPGAMAAVCLVLAWESHGYAKKFINGRTFWSYTLERNPDAWLAHNNVGYYLLQENRTAEAIDQFKQALQLQPDYADAHNNLGNVLQKQNRIPEAIAQYEQALRVDPDNAEAHNNLGQALVRAGRLPAALAEFESALQIQPDYAKAHTNLGRALMEAGRTPEAMTQFEEALKIEPGRAAAHNDRGLVLAQMGRFAEAAEEFEEAVKLKPDDAEAHNNLGAALGSIGRIPEAIAQCEAALAINPNYADARDNLAKLQARQKTNN